MTQRTDTSYTAIGLQFLFCVFLTACQPENRPTTPNQLHLPKPQIEDSTKAVSLMDAASTRHHQDIAQRLELSYARAAANRSNVCPKLLDFHSVNQSITRKNEQLPESNQDYCEYYIYLDTNDRLKVATSKDMQAALMSPIWFDFKNGEYTAKKFDKHTLRLSYDGTRYQPQNFVYDVVVTKNAQP